MSDEVVRQFLSLKKRPALGAAPPPSVTASSSGAPKVTERDDVIDPTLDADQGSHDLEPPAAEDATSLPALNEGQERSGGLSPIQEERAGAVIRRKGKKHADATDKGKGKKHVGSADKEKRKKRSNPSPDTQAEKRQRVHMPGVHYYGDETVYDFRASGPSDEDMTAFLKVHDGMHPVAKRFLNNLTPEGLAKEAQRAMVMVSVFLIEVSS